MENLIKTFSWREKIILRKGDSYESKHNCRAGQTDHSHMNILRVSPGPTHIPPKDAGGI